ncbi:MAG: Rrf2 family transcriptional regulator [Candidatus Omnitrophica bacterium]|nr:Rrf2 family transcriptional regulator [Candidatus Omnitrophota bacterium]MCM8799471.1 Rrf2 family transcriptional regulator [Candidatus Omnitrophota bacterium]
MIRISTELEYGLRAILELALNYSDKKIIKIKQIAKNQDIPLKYLEQILIQLKLLGFVESVRGKDGGYRLAKAPQEITIAEVMRKMGGSLFEISQRISKKDSVFLEIWEKVGREVNEILEKIDFEQIARKVRKLQTIPIYQI